MPAGTVRARSSRARYYAIAARVDTAPAGIFAPRTMPLSAICMMATAANGVTAARDALARMARSLRWSYRGKRPITQEIVMNNRCLSFVAVLAGAALLGACNQNPDPAKIQADVTKAQAAGQKNIADAQANLDKVNAQNTKDMVNAQVDARAPAADNQPTNPSAAQDMSNAHTQANGKTADAQYDLDKARAKAAEEVAEAKCEAQTGSAEDACNAAAKSQYDAAVAQAKSINDAAHKRDQVARN